MPYLPCWYGWRTKGLFVNKVRKNKKEGKKHSNAHFDHLITMCNAQLHLIYSPPHNDINKWEQKN